MTNTDTHRRALTTVQYKLEALRRQLSANESANARIQSEIADLNIQAQRLMALIQQGEYRQTYSFNLRYPETD